MLKKINLISLLMLMVLSLFILSSCDIEEDANDLPDLIITELSVTCWTPTSISYSYTIKNVGTAPANLDGPTSADPDNVSVLWIWKEIDTVENFLPERRRPEK